MIRYSLLQVLLPGVLLVLAGCQPNSATSEPEYFAAPGTEGMGLPFSGAVKVGQTVYLSGSIGNVPGKMQLVEGGLEAETRQTLENIAQSLEVAGGTLDDIVKCTIFLDDIASGQHSTRCIGSISAKSRPRAAHWELMDWPLAPPLKSTVSRCSD